MTPYADFAYFGFLLYPALPTVLLGLTWRFSWRWVLLVTLAVVGVVYAATSVTLWPGATVQEIWIVVAYAVYEYAAAVTFLRLRLRTDDRRVFYAAVGVSLLPLAVSKFLPLLAPGTLFGFLGISYVTFRALDVIFGVRDRLIKTLPPAQYLVYLFFFATVSSGPIDRYRRFEKDWNRTRTRAEFLVDLDQAVHKVMTGFLFKFILAALVKQYWMDPVTKGTDLGSILSYMYAYSFYLFFDFAGYSMFAIGLSYLFGIHTTENFNRPFLAKDIRDFWDRWHMSLSSWFRDHIYMRFLIAATRGKWFRNKYVASYLGFLLTFGLMGLWHGTQPYYLLYGLYHAVLMSGQEAFTRWNQTRHWWGEGWAWRVAGIAVTFNLVCFGFLLFSGHLWQLK